MNRRTLLTIDSIANLLLGVLLVWFPRGLINSLGIPDAHPAFYPNILGAVLFGVGIALWVERSNDSHPGSGLGIGGAVAINICGGLMLGLWLIFGDLALPVRGTIVLWALVIFLVGFSSVELMVRNKHIGHAGDA